MARRRLPVEADAVVLAEPDGAERRRAVQMPEPAVLPRQWLLFQRRRQQAEAGVLVEAAVHRRRAESHIGRETEHIPRGFS